MPGQNNNNNNNNNQNEQLDPRTLEQLNAYLDYELSESERDAVRDLLRRSPAAENEMATLKATSNVLRELPAVPSPRSFALRPAMLEQPVKTQRSFGLFGWRPTPTFALGLGSVAAACLLVFVLAVQLISNGGAASHQSSATAYNTNSTSAGGSNQANNPSGFTITSNGSTSTAVPPNTSSASAAATATPAQLIMSAAAAPPTEAGGVSGSVAPPPESGAGAQRGTATAQSAPTSPAYAFVPGSTSQPTSTESNSADNSSGIAASGASGTAENSPTASLPALTALNPTAKQAADTPTPEQYTAVTSNSNTASTGGGISASGPVPQNDTNKPNNYNVFQNQGMDYWLVIEIALAVLVVVLGLGALRAQRRTR